MIKNRNCPICNFGQNIIIEKINFILFEEHPINEGYDLVQCENCSFIYANVSVTQKQLDRYYANISKYEDKIISTGGGYNVYDLERLAGVAKYLSNIFPDKNIKIADIGCANGGLLEQLKKLGYNNIVGIDPSKSCVKITIEEKKIDCFNASIFDLDVSFGKYDLVILSHVWEHILDLNSAIASIEKILTPNGHIYIECPNAMNYKNTIHAPLQEFNSEHINHFYENGYLNFFGLRNYECTDIGSKIVKIASGEDYDAVYGIFQKSTNELNYQIKYDYEIIKSINEYILKSNKWFKEILNKIESEIVNEKQVAIYGVGQFAFKLLYEMVKKKPDLSLLLFDNNSLNVGKFISDFQILRGNDLINHIKNNRIKLIITSLIHQNSIKEKIISILNDKNNFQLEIIELK